MIRDWSGFFTTQAGVFAAITGLVFVALSINLKPILDVPGLTGRAAEAIVILVEPVLVGLVGLIPDQGARTFGAEVLAMATLGWIGITVNMVAARKTLRGRNLVQLVARFTTVHGATLTMIAGGALLLGGSGSGFYWLAAASGLCLIAGIFEAWVLLVEILR